MHTRQLIQRTLNFRSGTEGPRHDPYGWREVTVEMRWRYPDGVERQFNVTLRDGLGTRLSVNDRVIDVDEDKAATVFKILTGMTPDQAEEYDTKARFRCSACGNHRRFHSADGYPGETLYICSNCDEIVTGDFNRAAIE